MTDNFKIQDISKVPATDTSSMSDQKPKDERPSATQKLDVGFASHQEDKEMLYLPLNISAEEALVRVKEHFGINNQGGNKKPMEPEKKSLLDKLMKVVIMISVLVVAASIAYYLVYRPIQKQNYIKQCNEEAGELKSLYNIQYGKDFGTTSWTNKYEQCLKRKGVQ